MGSMVRSLAAAEGAAFVPWRATKCSKRCVCAWVHFGRECAVLVCEQQSVAPRLRLLAAAGSWPPPLLCWALLCGCVAPSCKARAGVRGLC